MNEPRKSKHIPLNKALLIIFLSTCLVSGSCGLVWLYYHSLQEKQRLDPAYQIVAVVQTSPDKEGLSTGYLTELLNLSVDRPKNLYAFNTKEAEQALLRLPVIKEVKIRKIRPGTLHVDYTLRKPIAYVGDSTNTAIDASGILIPFKPFYTPKKLPIIYFGGDEGRAAVEWGSQLTGKRKEAAFDLHALAPSYCDEASTLCSIDVSRAFAPSDGEREIILVLEDRLQRVVEGKTILCVYPRIVRLRPDNYRQQLGNYLVLRSTLRERDKIAPPPGKETVQRAKAAVIDLRLSELAFISD